jgi:hypothetical protein
MKTITDWTSAESVAKLARQQEQELGPMSPQLAETLTRLGDLHFIAEEFANAEDCYWRALSIRQKVLGEAHLDTAATLINLAELYEMQDRYAEAERFYQWAASTKKQAMLKSHSDRLETTQIMQRPAPVPRLSELRDVRCAQCNRQLLDSAVCLYCTQGGGFDAAGILRAAGWTPDSEPMDSSPVNVLVSPDGTKRFKLTEHQIRIGRHPSNNIIFSDERQVSRHHATLTFIAGGYVLTDSNTVNGTFVNGEKITGEHKLKRGDLVAFGPVVLVAESSRD